MKGQSLLQLKSYRCPGERRAQRDDFRTFLNEFVGDLTHRELAANLSFTIEVISDLGGSA